MDELFVNLVSERYFWEAAAKDANRLRFSAMRPYMTRRRLLMNRAEKALLSGDADTARRMAEQADEELERMRQDEKVAYYLNLWRKGRAATEFFDLLIKEQLKDLGKYREGTVQDIENMNAELERAVETLMKKKEMMRRKSDGNREGLPPLPNPQQEGERRGDEGEEK